MFIGYCDSTCCNNDMNVLYNKHDNDDKSLNITIVQYKKSMHSYRFSDTKHTVPPLPIFSALYYFYSLCEASIPESCIEIQLCSIYLLCMRERCARKYLFIDNWIHRSSFIQLGVFLLKNCGNRFCIKTVIR